LKEKDTKEWEKDIKTAAKIKYSKLLAEQITEAGSGSVRMS
jgi:hypothetical protein